MKIIDDAISLTDLENIKNVFYSTEFPWYYNDYKINQYETLHENSLYDFQMTHNFYKNYNVTSAYINLIEPILKILNPCAIFRIKANLTTKTEKIIKFPFHEDQPGFKGKTAIFYVNNNDGYTEIENKCIESISNRIVIFDSNLMHRGTTSTNTKTRCVINFNYFEWAY